jgi:hypothetical protein
MSETPLNTIEQLKLLAKRLQTNEEFMSFVLAAYQRREHIDDDHLMVQFNTTPEMLIRLALCKRPNTNVASFSSQLREISAYTKIDPGLLANVIRQVESIDALIKLPSKGVDKKGLASKRMPGLLAAARDQTEEKKIEENKADYEAKEEKGEDDVAG